MEVIINAEWEDAAKESLKSVIDIFSEGLNLESLEYLIIPRDFSSEIFSFQREKGLRQEFTKDGLGTAVGKNLSYFVGDEFKQSIFLDPNTFLLDPEKPNEFEVAVFLINHELCHAHDSHIKYEAFDWYHKPQENLSMILKNRADDIWSEYIANRLALRKINIDGTLVINASNIILNFDLLLLLDRITLTKERVDGSILEYRYHKNINQLLEIVVESASELLKASGRLYGHIHGLDLEEINILEEKINGNYFKSTWKSLGPELQDLYYKYPKWKNSDELDNLSKIVLKTWNSLGIYPRDTTQGMYVDVPFK